MSYIAEMTLTNTGEVPVTVTGVTGTIPVVDTFPVLPFTLEVDAIQVMTLQVDSSPAGAEFTLETSCDTDTVVTVPSCSFTITGISVESDAGAPDPNNLEEWNLGVFTLNNTGGVTITVTEYTGVGVVQNPIELPVEIPAGESQLFAIGGFDSTPNTVFTVVTDCGESEEQLYPFPTGYAPP